MFSAKHHKRIQMQTCWIHGRSGSIKALVDYLSFKTGKNTFEPLFNLGAASLPDSISC